MGKYMEKLFFGHGIQPMVLRVKAELMEARGSNNVEPCFSGNFQKGFCHAVAASGLCIHHSPPAVFDKLRSLLHGFSEVVNQKDGISFTGNASADGEMLVALAEAKLSGEDVPLYGH